MWCSPVENQLQPLQEADGRLGWTVMAAFPRRGHQWHEGAIGGLDSDVQLALGGSPISGWDWIASG
jgi:hypothetical protein